MALGGYLKSGTYSHIDNVDFSKKDKRITFRLSIYENANKYPTDLITTQSFDVFGDITNIPEIESFVTERPADITIETGAKWEDQKKYLRHSDTSGEVHCCIYQIEETTERLDVYPEVTDEQVQRQMDGELLAQSELDALKVPTHKVWKYHENQATSRYYKLKDGTYWYNDVENVTMREIGKGESYRPFMASDWDSFFGTDAQSPKDTNVTSQVYAYLKSRDIFNDVTDA